MQNRRTELLEISSYIQGVENDVTLILQSLQWDRKHLTEAQLMASCKYDSNHRVPPDKLELHEEGCHLKSLGYSEDDLLLPEPLDVNADTLVALSKNDIANIIEYAAKIDPLFKKGNMPKQLKITLYSLHLLHSLIRPHFYSALRMLLKVLGLIRGSQDSEPLTVERLQATYNSDERRAIHDAVVCAVPSCHDLMELALPSENSGSQAVKPKSRAEILLELRDMKRRRTKYRVAAKTRNYSDVLRDVITTQMEHYSEVQTEPNSANPSKNDVKPKDEFNKTKEVNGYKKYEEVHVKKEPVDDRNYSRDQGTQQKDKSKDKYHERERKKYDDYNKRDKHRDEGDKYSSSSKERSRDRKDYRSSDKYRKDDSRDSRRREYKDNCKPSRYSDVRYNHERDGYYDSHKQERRKRYYDMEEEFDVSIKRIKLEKD